MGLRWELISLGATTFKTPRVSKEGDSTFKPLSIRPRKADWPTIVLESGWFESLTKLRQDAHLWLENSGGDIKTVLLFSISRTARKMIIEKWENRLTQTLTQIQAITIDSNSNTVNGAPLTLEFRKSFSARPYHHWSTTSHLLRRTFRYLQPTSGLLCSGALFQNI